MTIPPLAEAADAVRAAPDRIGGAARRNPVSLIWIGVVLYATGPVMVRATSVSGPVISFWRGWFGVGVFAVAAAIHITVSGRRPSWAGLRFAFLTGLLWGCHLLMFFTAVKLTSVTDVTLIGTLSPIVTGVLAIPFFGERPGTGFRAWSIVAIAGAALVVLGGSTGPTGDPLGMALAILNVVLFAIFFLLSKRSRDRIDVIPFLLGVMTAGSVVITAFVLATGEPIGAASGRDLLLALAIAAGPGALGHFVMTWPLRWLPANIPPVIRLTIPVVASGMAWLFLGEGITWWHVAGGLVTLVGVTGTILSPDGRALMQQEREPDIAPAR